MKKQNWKKVVSLLAGSLVIALVVSILPGGFLVSAAEVKTATRAERIAIKTIEEELNENIDKELVKVTVNEDNLDDEENPFYTVLVETKDGKYGAKVYSKTGEVIVKSEDEIRSERDVKTKSTLVFENFADFENYPEGSHDIEDFIDNKGYEDYGNKPTAQASLNELLKDGKKAAISDFKEDGDKVAFEEAKGIIKDLRSVGKTEIKNTPPKKDDSDIKKLVDKKIISENEALFYALEAAEINNSKLDDLKKLEIVLDKDDSPTLYKIEFEYNGTKYEIEIDASTGAILDFDEETLQNVKVRDKYDDRDDDNDDDDDDDDDVDDDNGKGNSKSKGKGNSDKN